MLRLRSAALLAVPLALLLAACGPPAKKAAPKPILSAGAVAGKRLFATACTMCHGPAGDQIHLLQQPYNGMVKTLAGSQGKLAAFIQANAPMSDAGVPVNGMGGGMMGGQTGGMGQGMMHLSATQAQYLAAYIWSGSGSVKKLPAVTAAGDATRGQALFASKECAMCHGTAGDQVHLVNPPLARIADRLAGTPQRLAGFLKVWAPMTDAGDRNPSMSLSTKDSADLAAYLEQLGR
jgi:cytochrome c